MDKCYICKYCGKICKNKNSLAQHEIRCTKNSNRLQKIGPEKGCITWNKGLTKETNDSIKKQSETFKTNVKNGKIIPAFKGKHHTIQAKEKISEKLKIAHAEGRSPNIGENRRNHKPSYPESFIMNVIDNEIQNKNYVRELRFYRYSLDFAWINEKKCIEIDGEQHQRDFKQKERDIKKDELLKENGWKELRICWKDMFNNTKEYINIIKEFIDGELPEWSNGAAC